MGIYHLIGASSNLTDLSEDYTIAFDEMIHKAVIEVDEEGSVAAAATSTISTRNAFAQEKVSLFHCDHPFLFLINDQVSQEVLFAGVYRGPDE